MQGWSVLDTKRNVHVCFHVVMSRNQLVCKILFFSFQNGGILIPPPGGGTGTVGPMSGRPPSGSSGTVGKKAGGIAAKLSNHLDRLVARGGSIRGHDKRPQQSLGTPGFNDVTFNREYFDSPASGGAGRQSRSSYKKRNSNAPPPGSARYYVHPR